MKPSPHCCAHDNVVRLARLLSIVLALDMIQNMASPAFWIWGASSSVVANVSRLSSYPAVMPWLWLLLACTVLPFTVSQLRGYTCLLCTRLACWGLYGGGLLWVFYAWVGRNLDYPSLVMLFGFNGFISIAMAVVLAASINDGQKLAAKAGDEA